MVGLSDGQRLINQQERLLILSAVCQQQGLIVKGFGLFRIHGKCPVKVLSGLFISFLLVKEGTPVGKRFNISGIEPDSLIIGSLCLPRLLSCIYASPSRVW